MQQDLVRHGWLQPPLLRQGIQYAEVDYQGEMRVQVSLVLLRRVQNLREEYRYTHLQIACYYLFRVFFFLFQIRPRIAEDTYKQDNRILVTAALLFHSQ